ncbi:MAG: SDR family NAD(P)-dependent oxidoreductase [Candidatus Neoclostridium sp.]
MKGRTVLVTGGAKGIGKATAYAFASRGYNVAIAFNASQKEAFECVADLQRREINCCAFKADLTLPGDVERLYKECKNAFGFVDTVINNAGVCHYNTATDDDYDDYYAVMNANFGSVFGVCRLFIRDMIEWKSGSIVNVSSVWGARGASAESLYSASKCAIIGYGKSLAKELKPSGVRVNCILPGYVKTDMNARFSPEEQQAALKRMRQKRILLPEEIADEIVRLAECDKTGLVVKAYGK